MTALRPTAPEITVPPSDEAWITDLGGEGMDRELALRRLHGILLRACRHQVWRLRHLLPGAGAVDLEDIAQQAADDALVAVLRRLPSFQGRARFTTWAYKFGVLQAGVAMRRQAWRHREIPLSDTITPVDPSPTPGQLHDASQLARATELAIETVLTPHQRRVALALLVEEVPIDVLAERLGTTRNALYKTLHDARVRLRTALAASGHLDLGSTP